MFLFFFSFFLSRSFSPFLPFLLSFVLISNLLNGESVRINPPLPPFPLSSQAKSLLLAKLDSFIRDRILLADRVIEQHAIDKINDGDVILTYARSSVVEGVLLEAKRAGKEFSVVVVDSRPLYEGVSWCSFPLLFEATSFFRGVAR